MARISFDWNEKLWRLKPNRAAAVVGDFSLDHIEQMYYFSFLGHRIFCVVSLVSLVNVNSLSQRLHEDFCFLRSPGGSQNSGIRSVADFFFIVG